MGVLVVLGLVVLVTVAGVAVRAFRGEQPKSGGRRPGGAGTADPGAASHDSGGSGGSGSGWGWGWGSDSGNGGDGGSGGGSGESGGGGVTGAAEAATESGPPDTPYLPAGSSRRGAGRRPPRRRPRPGHRGWGRPRSGPAPSGRGGDPPRGRAARIPHRATPAGRAPGCPPWSEVCSGPDVVTGTRPPSVEGDAARDRDPGFRAGDHVCGPSWGSARQQARRWCRPAASPVGAGDARPGRSGAPALPDTSPVAWCRSSILRARRRTPRPPRRAVHLLMGAIPPPHPALGHLGGALWRGWSRSLSLSVKNPAPGPAGNTGRCDGAGQDPGRCWSSARRRVRVGDTPNCRV